jgi:hypothetical protein
MTRSSRMKKSKIILPLARRKKERKIPKKLPQGTYFILFTFKNKITKFYRYVTQTIRDLLRVVLLIYL